MITPILKDLHWLPIGERIKYKLLLLPYKAQNGLAPKYLEDLVVPYVPPRDNLRSKDQHLLEDNVWTKLKSYGDRNFRKAAGVLWNTLSSDV